MMCNAGFGVAGAIDEVPPATRCRSSIDINYIGTYHADARGAAAVPAPEQPAT